MERISSKEYRRRLGLMPSVATNSKPQIRLPKKREPNKTEAAWIAQCERKYPLPHFKVLYEPLTLNLPSGTRYTPDVVVVDGSMTDSARVRMIYEVKGAHIHNQRSIHAFKEARSAFPFWRFGFAQLVKGEWRVAYD